MCDEVMDAKIYRNSKKIIICPDCRDGEPSPLDELAERYYAIIVKMIKDNEIQTRSIISSDSRCKR